MKWLRVRLSTIMLLIIIIALGSAMVIQDRRHRAREADLAGRLQAEREFRDFDNLMYKNELKQFRK